MQNPKRIAVREVPRYPDTFTEDETDGVQVPHAFAGEIDQLQLQDDLGKDTVWVGEGSPWECPWQPGTGQFSIADGLTVNTDDPEDINRALALAIRWNRTDIFPSRSDIKKALEGKHLATAEPTSAPSHADVLLALAAGNEYQA